MTGVFIRERRRFDTHRHREDNIVGKPCEDGNKDWKDTSASSMPKYFWSHWKLGQRHRIDSLSDTVLGNNPVENVI